MARPERFRRRPVLAGAAATLGACAALVAAAPATAAPTTTTGYCSTVAGTGEYLCTGYSDISPQLAKGAVAHTAQFCGVPFAASPTDIVPVYRTYLGVTYTYAYGVYYLLPAGHPVPVLPEFCRA